MKLLFTLSVALLVAPLASNAQTIPAPVGPVSLKTVDGKTVQVALSEVETGIMAAAVAGDLVSTEGIGANADGSFVINSPRILANGKMAVITPPGQGPDGGSDGDRICQYFHFSKNVGGYRARSPIRENMVSVRSDGSIRAGFGDSYLLELTCK